MKAICSKDNLIEGINIVQKAVPSKAPMQILEGILVEADEKLKLTGNDFEIGIECYIEADIMQKGCVVINSRIFGDIVRRLPESEILIEVKDNNIVIIECENSHFEIKGLPSSGFPAIPVIEKENAFSISEKVLRDMIRQTIFSASLDENRPILTGSLMEYKNNQLALVSIDGYRLALRKHEIQNETENINVVIPAKTLNEVVKILQPADNMVTIYCANNQIMFDMGSYKVTSRLLEGEYLNYRGIIPNDYETKITVNTRDILSSIERASLVISSDERRYPVKLNIADDLVVITSSTTLGNVREEVRVDMTGKSIEIGFNPRYLIEALKAIDDEVINIYFTTNVGPCTIRPVESDDFAYMILPVRQ